MATEESVYLVCVFLVAAVAGASRCVRNGDYNSIGNLISVAAFSGMLGFGVVAIMLGDIANGTNRSTLHLGVAAIIGLAGKEQSQIVSRFWQSILNIRFGNNKNE